MLDPAQHDRFRDAFVELPFDLAEVLFITTANEPARILPALRDRLEIIDLPGYSEDEKVAIARTHLIAAQNRAAGLAATPVRFTPGACRRIIRDYTSEPGVRQLARCLQSVCRQVALGLETGDSSRVRDRVTVRQVRAFLGAPGAGHTDGLARLREQLEAPALPAAVRDRGRQILARLSAWAPTDPDHARAREYLECLLSVPWARRTAAAPIDLARARSLLDTGHAAHGAVKERLIDYVAVRLSNPDAPSGLLCLLGPPGVGKTTLAGLVAGVLGRACAWVACGGLANAAALHGARSGPPGRIVEELRRVGVRNPLVVLDEIDRLDEAGGTAAALLDALDPAPGAAVRDRYLDLPVDLSEALFVATASSLGPVPAMLRERMTVIELPGYTEAEKRAIATAHLLPRQLALHGLTADQIQVTDEAVEALIRGYTREAGVWRLRSALGKVCAKVVRRRAGGDTAPIEVTPPALAAMLGAPMPAGAEVAGRTAQPGVAVGLCQSARGGAVILRRSDPDGRRRGTDPHRSPGGGHAGVGAHRAVLAPGPRRPLRPRPGLPPQHRRACARAGRQGADRGGVGRSHHGGGTRVRVHQACGPRRPGHDRRDHPRRSGAARRRHQGEGARGAPRQAGPRSPAAAEPQARRRGPRPRPAARGRRPLRDAHRRAARAGAAASAGGGRGRGTDGAGHAGALSAGRPGGRQRSAT